MAATFIESSSTIDLTSQRCTVYLTGTASDTSHHNATQSYVLKTMTSILCMTQRVRAADAKMIESKCDFCARTTN